MKILKVTKKQGFTLSLEDTFFEKSPPPPTPNPISVVLGWTSEATKDAEPDANPTVAAIGNPINAIFKIRDTKLYVPIVTLSTENYKKTLGIVKMRI